MKIEVIFCTFYSNIMKTYLCITYFISKPILCGHTFAEIVTNILYDENFKIKYIYKLLYCLNFLNELHNIV